MERSIAHVDRVQNKRLTSFKRILNTYIMQINQLHLQYVVLLLFNLFFIQYIARWVYTFTRLRDWNVFEEQILYKHNIHLNKD